MNLNTKVVGVLAAMAVGAIALPALAAIKGQPLPPRPPSAPDYSAFFNATNTRLTACSLARDHRCETEVSGEESAGEALVETYFALYYFAQSHYRTETAASNALATRLNADCTKLKAHHLTCA